MTSDDLPKFAGGCTFRFAADADGRLVEVTAPGLLSGGPGADLEVVIDLYTHRRRLICGGVRVTSAPHEESQLDDTLGTDAAGLHIDSALWRQLPIGRMIEESVWSIQSTAQDLLRVAPRPWMESVASADTARSRPGPRPTLTPELLAEVVAPAFLSGGRKPVEAVRVALEVNGYPGSGPSGDVTIDQARKAVTKARALDLIPPAKRNSR